MSRDFCLSHSKYNICDKIPSIFRTNKKCNHSDYTHISILHHGIITRTQKKKKMLKY